MYPLSTNAAGIVVFILSVIGVNVTDIQAADLIAAVGTVISFGLLIYNQLKREDIKWFFFKKKD